MSDLIFIPDESPEDQPGTEEGYGQQPVGKTEADCKAEAESSGGVVWDEHAMACWNIFGKAVIIGSSEHSIEEAFKVVNFNFHANGTQAAVPTQTDLPGAVEDTTDPSLTAMGYTLS